jgi:hypothetical protein
MKEWTIEAIKKDFENQIRNMKRKFCPLINKDCQSQCYNYYSAKGYVNFEKYLPSISKYQTILFENIDDSQINQLKYVKQINSYSFYPESCQFFDSINNLEFKHG